MFLDLNTLSLVGGVKSCVPLSLQASGALKQKR